jgi:hypothetical protein
VIGVKRLRIIFACCAAALLLVAAPAAAQPFEYTFDNGWNGAGMPPLPATGFWDANANWNNNLQPGTANNVVPYAYFEETALLGGTLVNGTVSFAPVTVNVRTFQDTLGTSSTSPVANRRAVAGVTVANGSTLNIQSTGRLSVLVTHGTNGATSGLPTPGTGSATVSSGGMINVQSMGQLNVEDNIIVNDGTLTVSPGAIVTAQNVDSGAAGAIVLSGDASLTSSGSTTLGGRTTITGAGVTFNSGRLVMTDSTVFNPVITGATHSIINVAGPVTMNGTLRPQFQSVTPALGSTWTLWDSTSTGGTFDFSDDALTPLPQGHRYAIVTTSVGSVRGSRGQLTIENVLTAEVNRANGQVTIRNTAATGGVTIDGYQIASAAGVLNPAAFTSSLDDDNFDGGEWLEANSTPGLVGELNGSGNSLIATSSSNALGNIYNPIPTIEQFGDPVPQDLVFTYRRSDGRFVTGEVEYINDGIDNTLVLQVDPTDGKARIINDSTFNVAFDSYRVRSESNSLNPNWNSLDDQNVGGANGWLEARPTAGVLSELNPLGSLAVPAGATAAVMSGLFNFASGTPDLLFDFRIPAGGGLPTSTVLNGIVRYAPFSLGLDGDFNDDGRVNAADYVVWRKTDGSPAGYNEWRMNFGATSGSGAAELGASQVPEPAAVVLMLSLTCGCLLRRPRIVALTQSLAPAFNT